MDTQDDQPEKSSSEDESGLPPGWYPEPAGGWGLRWWDGTRWTEYRRGPSKPAVKWTWSWTWSLSIVFYVELALTMVGLFVSVFSIFSMDACMSDRCYDLVVDIWLGFMAAHAWLGVVCGLAFWWSKSIWVKCAAALFLPIGLVTTWVVADRMLTSAVNM